MAQVRKKEMQQMHQCAQLCYQYTKIITKLFSFQKCNLSVSCIVFIYDCAYYDGNY